MRRTNWTSAEDNLLNDLVSRFRDQQWSETSWDEISNIMGTRTPTQCRQRFQNFLDVEKITRPWTSEEDELLLRAIDTHGTADKWSKIASYMLGRRGKQCRERFHNHLSPGINKDPWEDHEDRVIILKQTTYGNGWAEICQHLSGRTDNAVKNRWNCSLRLHVLNFFREQHGFPPSKSLEAENEMSCHANDDNIDEIIMYIKNAKERKTIKRVILKPKFKKKKSTDCINASKMSSTSSISSRNDSDKENYSPSHCNHNSSALNVTIIESHMTHDESYDGNFLDETILRDTSNSKLGKSRESYYKSNPFLSPVLKKSSTLLNTPCTLRKVASKSGNIIKANEAQESFTDSNARRTLSSESLEFIDAIESGLIKPWYAVAMFTETGSYNGLDTSGLGTPSPPMSPTKYLGPVKRGRETDALEKICLTRTHT